MIRLALESGASVWLMPAAAAAVLLALAAAYARIGRLIAPARARGLYLLRAAAALLLIALLFRPLLRIERDERTKRTLVLLVDTSASMATPDEDHQANRLDAAKRLVLDWSARLAQTLDVKVVAFDERARVLERPGDVAALEPKGQATSLSRGLVAASRVVERTNLEAVVLLSDGRHNATGDPLAVARAGSVPVHTVGIGQSARENPTFRDVRVVGLECAPTLPVGSKAEMVAQVEHVGLVGRVVPVVLEEDGKEVARSELVLGNAETPLAVTFQHRPTEKGRHEYVGRVIPPPGETITVNDRRSALAQVVDAKIRVLYVEGTLRAEYGALVQRFLSKDPDLEFCALVQTRPGVFLARSNIAGLTIDAIPADAETLARFDVILLGDLDSVAWKPSAMEAVAARVKDGAGLLMLGGYHSLGPGGYEGTPIEAILPVLVGGRDIGQLTDAFMPRLTPEGRAHPIFANIGPFFPSAEAAAAVAGLPPLEGCVKVVRARPGASVLAVHPEQTRMPVFAVQPVEKGRTAVFTADTTRNWQQVLRALDRDSPFVRFWGQSVRWLAGRSDEMKGAGVSVRTDRAAYEPDAPVTIDAIVRDSGGEGTSSAHVEVHLARDASAPETVALSAEPDSPGRYRGRFEPQRAGSYKLSAEARLDSSTLTSEPAEFVVGRPDLESERLELDEARLGAIAQATGGRAVTLPAADTLLDLLDQSVRTHHVRLERRLFHPALFWGLFLGLIGTEWFLRKRYHLR
jgi:uncharacterized membrane protein